MNISEGLNLKRKEQTMHHRALEGLDIRIREMEKGGKELLRKIDRNDVKDNLGYR